MTKFKLCLCLFILFLIRNANGTIPAEPSSPETSSQCYGENLSRACQNTSKIAITSYYDGFKKKSDNCPVDGSATGTCCSYEASGDCLQENPTETRYVDELSGKSDGIISSISVSPISDGACNSSNYSVSSVFSQLNFLCIPDQRISSMCTSVNSIRSSLPLYLQNRNYPDGILNSDTSCTCSVEALSDGSIDMYIVHMDLYDTPGNCQQNLIVKDVEGNVLRTFNCDNEEFNVIKNETITTNYIVIELTNNYITTNAGKFWLGFKGALGSDVVVNCPANLIDCRAPPSIANGTVEYTSTRYGSTATYSCNTGYNMTSGDSVRYCGADGNRNGTLPVCTLVDCGILTLVNGNVATLSGTTYGQRADFACDTGYTLANFTSAYCLETGQWNASVTCTIIDCGILTLENGNVATLSGTTYGQRADFACDTGYTLANFTSAFCLETGQWNASVTCTIIVCSGLTNITNGTVSAPAADFNTPVIYTCAANYFIRSGNPTRTCLANGTFDGTEPECVLADCGIFETTQGLILDLTNGYLNESVAEFSCEAGYDLNGTHILQCINEDWNGMAPSCVIKDCGLLRNINNGNVNTSSGTTFESEAIYTCETGYKIKNGTSTRTCGADGIWTDAEPTCQLQDCGDLSVINGSPRIPQGTTFGDLAVVTCDPGYTLNGDSLVTCESNGTHAMWDPIPTCDIIDCGDPTPDFGSIVGSTFTFNSNVDVACNTGYKLSGSARITCQDNGMWSDTTKCEIVSCSNPKPASGTLDSSVFTYNSTVTITCNTGFTLRGSENITCQANGTWTDTASCSLIDCGDPTPTSGSLTGSVFTYNSTVTVTCNTPFNLTGSESITCQENGQWSDTTTCQPIDCGSPQSVNHGTFWTLQGTTFGATALLTCDPGFSIKVDTDPIVTCQENGTWSPSSACEILVSVPGCRDPTPSSGSASSAIFTVNSNVNISCDPGFTLNGSSVITCQEDGEWSDIVTCTPVECERLPALLHGRRNSNETTYTTVVSFTCNEGYNLNGSQALVCQQNGIWNSTKPTCDIQECPAPSNIPHGYVSAGFHPVYGDDVQYMCDKGFYRIAGNQTRRCQADGKLSGTEPTCTIHDCGTLQTPSHTSKDNERTTYTMLVKFTCNEGYNLAGSSALMCQEDGSWNGTEPTCVKQECPVPSNITSGYVTTGLQSMVYGDLVNYTCYQGYYISAGNQTRRCQANGTLSGTEPTCTLHDCGKIYDIPNGDIQGLSNTSYGSTLTFVCDDGYKLKGPRHANCLATGKWSSLDTSCKIDEDRNTITYVGIGIGVVFAVVIFGAVAIAAKTVSFGGTTASAAANQAPMIPKAYNNYAFQTDRDLAVIQYNNRYVLSEYQPPL